ncbi:alpha/beta fold hydrolase [Pedobacter caeni]|uniref:TAP-like protein n=1 Tax=Pedobacter caeni TaxID=288992 RepID=A0A1M5A1B9_9SPHI|nr:alpha/beta fold hydrolase [Pedobacter caeni]SHF24004.1 TAP-like protein [Pedobacter caeni]
MKALTAILLFFLAIPSAIAQGYHPKIELTNCPIKIGDGVIAKCGYLVVPENRQKPGGRQIKIPFVFVRKPAMDTVNNIFLYTTGGPGYSTIDNIDQITVNSGFLKYGGFIAFDQRGTKKSIPSLDCPGIDDAIKRSYREHLPKDSLVLQAIKQCREKLAGQEIDLSAYNTVESAADINDLRLALHIQSMSLVGISYSGGLMLTVVRNHPQGIKSLILNSPLPGYVNYEEHGLFNMNEALEQLFANCKADSSNQVLYGNLKESFQKYFIEITGKSFSISYKEKSTGKTFPVQYGKNELLDVIINRMNALQLKSLPFVITEIIKGRHDYVQEVLDNVFAGNPGYSVGMRFSVYCTEQIVYSNPELIKKQEEVLPWFAGYTFNDVNHPICECWKVKAENPIVKTPVYANIPVLLSAGDADPWCRQFYNQLIKRTMPNSQLLLIHNRGHGSGFIVDGIDYLELFLKNPYQKLTTQTKDLKIE